MACTGNDIKPTIFIFTDIMWNVQASAYVKLKSHDCHIPKKMVEKKNVLLN